MAVGGAQRVLLTQATWFHAQGYQVTVAFFYDKEALYGRLQAEYLFPVIDLCARKVAGSGFGNSLRFLKGMMRLWKLLRRGRFDIIETFTPHSNLVGLPLARLAGAPARIASHHGVIENISPWMERLHGKLVNSGIVSSLVAVSSRVYNYAVEQEGARTEKVKLIPNGVSIPPERAFTKDDWLEVRQGIGVECDGALVIAVGRLTEQKGHKYLLGAAAKIIRRFPKTTFAVVGDGPQMPALEEQVRRLGIKDNLRLLGTRADVYRLLYVADIFVLPSLSEGMPMALLEAMGMGLPVVATNLAGIADVVEDGRHGLLVPPGEVESLELAIARLLSDAQLSKQLAQAGRKLVFEQYTVERMCRTYEELFLAVLSQENIE